MKIWWLYFALLVTAETPHQTVTLTGEVVDEHGVGIPNVRMSVWTFGDYDFDGDVDLRDIWIMQRRHYGEGQGVIWGQVMSQLRGPNG